jgi:hypothetical protein
MTLIVSPPLRERAVEPDRYLTRPWRNYLLDLQNVGQASPQVISQPPVHLTGQTATIPTTPLTLPGLTNGFYRISVYQQILTADAVSSSLTTTIGWTNNTVPLTKSLPVMNGNTILTQDSLTWFVHLDNSSPVTYHAVYASNTPGAMVFELDVLVELVSA